MSKAYLLVVCLLAASFTGCLADDTSDSIEQGENTEEETIEPVGTHNNETDDYWYDILNAEVQNLTNEVEELNDQISILQEEIENLSETIDASTYKPPANSSASFTTVGSSYANYGMEIDIQMINETTIILNMSSLNPQYQVNYENAVIAFYNFYGGVIQFGEVRDLYDYCEYREIAHNYDENGTFINYSFDYAWSEGKTDICDAGIPSSSLDNTPLQYVFELPYQPTSVGFSQYKYTSGNTVDYIKTFQ